jgi:hypothetical protein
MTGAYDALAFVDVESINQLEELVRDKIRGEAGARGTETSVALYGPDGEGGLAATFTPLWPHRGIVPDHEVLARIRCQSGMASAVIQELTHVQGFHAAAIVAGPFDILLELGAPSVDELGDDLLNVNGVNGILWSDSAFASIVAAPGLGP